MNLYRTESGWCLLLGTTGILKPTKEEALSIAKSLDITVIESVSEFAPAGMSDEPPKKKRTRKKKDKEELIDNDQVHSDA